MDTSKSESYEGWPCVCVIGPPDRRVAYIVAACGTIVHEAEFVDTPEATAAQQVFEYAGRLKFKVHEVVGGTYDPPVFSFQTMPADIHIITRRAYEVRSQQGAGSD